MKKQLPNITLLGIDCVDISRLRKVMDICERDFSFGAVKLLSSQSGENIVKIEPINSLEEYSAFIINELINYVDTDYVLIVQHDGFILNPKAWTDEFLNYDYIGAPWKTAQWSIDKFDFPKELLGKYVVGNGGFSLRSRKLLELTRKLKFQRFHPEDVAIGVYNRKELEQEGIKFAPVALAKQFSFEAEDDKHYAWDGQFGFHGLTWTDIGKWSEEHPEEGILNPVGNINN